MYLTSDAVDSALAFIFDNAAEGSIVAFDYIYASVLRVEKIDRYFDSQISEGQIQSPLVAFKSCGHVENELADL